MSELTSLTLAQARDLLRKREFSAVELTKAHAAAARQARVLNAFVLETPEQAREMAAHADAALAKGEGRALPGSSPGLQELFPNQGLRPPRGIQMAGNLRPT